MDRENDNSFRTYERLKNKELSEADIEEIRSAGDLKVSKTIKSVCENGTLNLNVTLPAQSMVLIKIK